MMNYDSYIKKAKKSIFRFEGLQDYSAEDGEDLINDYIKTGKLSFHPSDTKWWQYIRQKNQNGVITHRVRLVVIPMSNYTKWELAWLREVAEYSGEDVRVIEQAGFDKIFDKSLPDFYIVDDLYAFPMKYGPKGKFLGDEIVKDDELIKYLDYKKKLLAYSVPIKQWK
jgi:hypothetical protein